MIFLKKHYRSGLMMLAFVFLSSCALQKKMSTENPPPLPVETATEDQVLVHGEISLDSHFKQDIPSGGEIHLRLVDMDLGRARVFRIFKNVQFPFHYELKSSDYVKRPVTDIESSIHRYFLEAIYYNFSYSQKNILKHDGLMGEAWGAPGRPYPLTLGSERNFSLNAWATEELVGTKELPKGFNAAGWLWIQQDVRKQLKPNQKVSVRISIFENDKSSHLIATETAEIPDINVPVVWHSDQNFKIKHGYFNAEAQVIDNEGHQRTLLGGRASERVSIKLNVRALKIVLWNLQPL